jgi:AcrR family transcriptional regulator
MGHITIRVWWQMKNRLERSNLSHEGVTGEVGTALGSNKNPLTHQQVIETTIEIINHFGVMKTSMIDVAQKLGVTRQTVHRLFPTRDLLLQAVAEDRILAIGRRLAPAFAKYRDIEEALVQGTLQALAAARTDHIVNQIQQKADHSIDQYMFQGSPLIQNIMVELWGPLLDNARAQGRLRHGVDNETIVEWIRNVHAMFTMRLDYTENQIIKFLQDFIVPSVVIAPARP